ncbi:MAG: hypothetical protein PVG20_09050 [Thioalkalispiraceae bacterium]|jgi:hypothetical protein
MKFRYIQVALVLIIPYVFIPSSYAEALLELGIHSGGDEITLVDGSNTVIESTKAGSLYSFSLGGTLDYTDTIAAQLSFGIKSDSNFTKDNEASWVRYPFNAMLFYHRDNFRLGLGATVHFSPKYKVSGETKNASSSYKDALGALFEIDYRLNQQFHLGLRYTDIKYVRETDSASFDGSSVGLLLIVLI